MAHSDGIPMVEMQSLALAASDSGKLLELQQQLGCRPREPLPTDLSDRTAVQDFRGTVGDFKSVMNLALGVVGTGLLSLPVAVARSGYGTGVFLVLGTWALTHTMMQLLFRSVQTARHTGCTDVTYAAIGALAYGKPGRFAVACANYFDLWAVCVILIQLTGTSLSQLTQTLSTRLWILISGLCIMLPFSLLPSLKEIGVLSAIGVIAFFIISITVLIVACVIDPRERGPIQATPASFQGFVSGFLQFMNAFTVAPVLPSIITSMKYPDHFPRASAIGFALAALAYSVVGFGGYISFGADILRYGLVQTGMSEKARALGSSGYATVCQISLLAVGLANFLVQFHTVAQLSDSFFTNRRPITAVLRNLARISLVVSMMIPAIFIPGFIFAVDLISATVVLPLTVIMPILLYAKICRADIDRLSPIRRHIVLASFGVTIVLCAVAMAAGLYEVISGRM